jgi:signal transduction histidine kinase
MHEVLFDYFLTRFQVLVILLLAAGAGGAIYWVRHRHWHNQLLTLGQERDRAQEGMRALETQLATQQKPSAYRHNDLLTGLTFILQKSQETMNGLRDDQTVIRDKQKLLFSKAQELLQSARNVLDLPESYPGDPPKEFLNVKGLVEITLRELYVYAESKGVTLRTNLADVEPTFLNRDLTLQAIKNVIHNAIKYSLPGGIVDIELGLESDELDSEET